MKSTAAKLAHNHVAKSDWLPKLIAWSGAMIVAALFFLLLSDLLLKGWAGFSWAFLTEAPQKAGRAGGIAPILVSTAAIMVVCLFTAVPLGIATAVFLSEWTQHNAKLGSTIRQSLDILAGVPSIVFGLFGHAFFSVLLGLGFSILAGGLTLACMVLPILIRTLESGLRALPAQHRSSAAALGLSRRATLFTLLLPAAAPALLVGLLLGAGRAIAETAALIFTSGYVDRMPESLLDSGRALSIHIFDLSMNIPGGDRNAYASALVLILILSIGTVFTRLVIYHWQRQSLS